MNQQENPDGYYENHLGIGAEFQDYMADWLFEIGISLNNYCSKKYQIDKGENRIGAEIKRDDKFRDTGNLFIETAEKTAASNFAYIPSGICREDNAWLYIIGDEKTVWIFSKRHLRRWCGEHIDEVEIERGTAKGCLVPIKYADVWAIRKLERPR